MGERVHILHLNSSSSEQTYSDNRVEDFRFHLPVPLTLEPVGDWFCCIRQCSFGFAFPGPLYLCCDICQDSIAGERKLPVLRVVHQRTGVVYTTCLYVPVKIGYISELRIFLVRTRDYKPPEYSTTGKPTHVTLEFVRGLQLRAP